jgi:2-polyprenyl-6-methoxyphenol hydroxylase-like FAD-dependent oxidoreductase
VCDVATFSVEIARCANFVREGVVLIGDSFRTSCPAVGTGLSCAMVDVLRLRDHVAEWLKTPGMGREKIVAFYNDPIKRARDESTHERAFRRRDAVNTVSRAHKLYRAAHFAKRGLRDRLGLGA